MILVLLQKDKVERLEAKLFTDVPSHSLGGAGCVGLHMVLLQFKLSLQAIGCWMFWSTCCNLSGSLI